MTEGVTKPDIIWSMSCVCVCLCLVPLCDPMDCSPPGCSVYGILQARTLDWLPFPLSEDLSDQGIEPTFPVSPVSAGRFFTTEPPGTCSVSSNECLLSMSPQWFRLGLNEPKATANSSRGFCLATLREYLQLTQKFWKEQKERLPLPAVTSCGQQEEVSRTLKGYKERRTRIPENHPCNCGIKKSSREN